VEKESIGSSEERDKLIGKLIKEIKLRKYSFETGKRQKNTPKSFMR